MKHSVIMAGAAVLVLAGCACGQQLVKPGKAVYADSSAPNAEYLDKLLHGSSMTDDQAAYLKRLGMDATADINSHKETLGSAFIVQLGDIPVSAGIMIDGSAWAPVSNIAKALGSSADYDAHNGKIMLTPPASSDGPKIENVVKYEKATLAYVKDVSVIVKFAGADTAIKALTDKGVTEDSITKEITSKVKAAGMSVDDSGDNLMLVVTLADENNGTICYSMDLRLFETARLDSDLTIDDNVPTFSTEGVSYAPKADPGTPFIQDVDTFTGVLTDAYTEVQAIVNK